MCVYDMSSLVLCALSQCIQDEDSAISLDSDDYNIYEDLDLDALALGGGLFAPDASFKPRGDSEDAAEGKTGTEDDASTDGV